MPGLLRRAVFMRSIAALFLLAIIVISLSALADPHRARYRFSWGSKSAPVHDEHKRTKNGLVVVDPDGPHPIFRLIRDGEAAWDAKCARASKTLDEAVAEYRRRYRRAPPLGFDKWWDYAVKHRVQLPDEYDEIFRDIEPFWGIDPHELARSRRELEARDDIVTVEKTIAQPRFEIVRSTVPPDKIFLHQRVLEIMSQVRDVEIELPPMRIAFYPNDNPILFADWQIKAKALNAAANGTTLRRWDLPQVTATDGWIQGCPPDSPAYLHPPIKPSSSAQPLLPGSSKTFIASHRDAMDPCMHPSLFSTHGQFLSYLTGPSPEPTPVPCFSMCSTLLHYDIRPPVPYAWSANYDSDPDEDEGEDEYKAFDGDVPWERKTTNKLGWRGRTTGIHASRRRPWMHGHRARLVTLANALEGNVSVLRVPIGGTDPMVASRVGEPESVPLAQVNPAWMNVAFTGEPLGCDESDGTCDEMTRMWKFLEFQGRAEEGQYKFVLDVDGNGWSGRFKRLMTGHALIFKATIYPEWYTSRVAPWVHYVPIQMSYADLYDAVAFFRVHDELARRIAQAGRTWSRRFWRREDMTAYLYRLLLEYARVMSLDRAAMDYIG